MEQKQFITEKQKENIQKIKEAFGNETKRYLTAAELSNLLDDHKINKTHFWYLVKDGSIKHSLENERRVFELNFKS